MLRLCFGCETNLVKDVKHVKPSPVWECPP